MDVACLMAHIQRHNIMRINLIFPAVACSEEQSMGRILVQWHRLDLRLGSCIFVESIDESLHDSLTTAHISGGI